VGAALFQWVNPKAWLVSASAAGTYLDAGAGSAFAQAVQLGVLFAAVAMPASFPWLGAGVAIRRVLRSPRALRAFNVSMGVILAASVVLFVW
jgi:threonine/homoserine/homoserine lactone efflux protein